MGGSEMIKKLMNFIKHEKGVTMVEYALLLALIAIVSLSAVGLVGTRASSTYNTAALSLTSAGGGGGGWWWWR
jgi:pilus assembly protein Flp/PilA